MITVEDPAPQKKVPGDRQVWKTSSGLYFIFGEKEGGGWRAVQFINGASAFSVVWLADWHFTDERTQYVGTFEDWKINIQRENK
jgi:hypothetical protein